MDRRNKEYNKNLIKRFPFLEPRNDFSGLGIIECSKGKEGFWPRNPEKLPIYDYEYTLANDFPEGWWKAFGEQMCEEIQVELNKIDEVEYPFYPQQIKEKFGSLRFYTNWSTKEIDNIISKYEELSKRTCVMCGAPATKISTGWICPYCDNCANRFDDVSKFHNIEKFDLF